MATIDSLANETLDKIMGILQGPAFTSREEWPKTDRYDALRAAALVCSWWRDPAQRALFEEVALIPYTCKIVSQLFLASPAQSRYRTRSLWVDSAPRWWDVAQACDRLENLVLGCPIDLEQSWAVLASPSFKGACFLPISPPANFESLT